MTKEADTAYAKLLLNVWKQFGQRDADEESKRWRNMVDAVRLLREQGKK